MEIYNSGKSLKDLYNGGFTPKEIRLEDPNTQTFTVKNLKDVGYKLSDIVDGDYTVSQIEPIGDYDESELRSVGISAKDLRYVQNTSFNLALLIGGGYTVGELRFADYTIQDLYNNTTKTFTILEIIEGQFSLDEIKSVGYTARQLKYDGNKQFSVQQLHDANYTALNLKEADYTVAEIKGIYSLLELIQAEYSNDELKNNGFSDSPLILFVI